MVQLRKEEKERMFFLPRVLALELFTLKPCPYFQVADLIRVTVTRLFIIAFYSKINAYLQ